MTTRRVSSLITVLVAAAACAAEPRPAAEITQPADGDTVNGPDVRVLLGATGIEIAPAAEMREGTAHHHLLVNRDELPAGDALPQGEPDIIHLGLGQTEHILTGLSPGSYRVIAVLADFAHVPLPNAATDTIRFTVRAPATP